MLRKFKLIFYFIFFISCRDIKSEKRANINEYSEKVSIEENSKLKKEQFRFDSITNRALQNIGWDKNNPFRDNQPFVFVTIAPFSVYEGIEVFLKLDNNGICQKSFHSCYNHNGYKKKLKNKISFINGLGLKQDIYYSTIIVKNYKDTMINNFLKRDMSSFKELTHTGFQGKIEKIYFDKEKEIFYFPDIKKNEEVKFFFQKLLDNTNERQFLLTDPTKKHNAEK